MSTHKLLYLCTQKGGVRMSAKMGRPTDNPKTEIIKVRATKEDRERLLYCCEQTGKTQYDIVMEGIKLVEDKIKK